MRRRSLRSLIVLGLILGVSLVWRPAARYVRAAQFLQRMAHQPAVGAAPAAPVVATREVTISGEHGPIRARLYFRADQPRGEGIVVAHGVHYKGIDEGRLVPFARGLAESGLTVLTPELSDLADYRITDSGVGVIRDAVRYLAADRQHVRGDRVGLLGFSFAGGLSLVAAEDPETSERLSFVTSVGGHHDLRRVMRFLIHNEIEGPSGIVHLQAHEYGLVVLVYGNLEQFVPASDLEAMRAGFKAWLHEDRKAARESAKARTTPEANALWDLLEAGKLQSLASRLDALLEAQQTKLAALSAARHLAELNVPVYLLHGARDNVIPPSETDAAGLELGAARHVALVSPLIEHVEVSKSAGLSDEFALVSFMAQLL
jgi:dienelactone hydrolase